MSTHRLTASPLLLQFIQPLYAPLKVSFPYRTQVQHRPQDALALLTGTHTGGNLLNILMDIIIHLFHKYMNP